MSIFDRLREGVLCRSADETRALAAELAKALPPRATIALHGTLGVGKTTFTSGLAAGFGVREPVTSPTYTYYSVHRGSRTLVHLDAYRLESARAVEGLLLDEFLEDPWCLVVEWPENTGEWLPADALHLELSIVEPGVHRVRLCMPAGTRV